MLTVTVANKAIRDNDSRHGGNGQRNDACHHCRLAIRPAAATTWWRHLKTTMTPTRIKNKGSCTAFVPIDDDGDDGDEKNCHYEAAARAEHLEFWQKRAHRVAPRHIQLCSMWICGFFVNLLLPTARTQPVSTATIPKTPVWMKALVQVVYALVWATIFASVDAYLETLVAYLIFVDGRSQANAAFG